MKFLINHINNDTIFFDKTTKYIDKEKQFFILFNIFKKELKINKIHYIKKTDINIF